MLLAQPVQQESQEELAQLEQQAHVALLVLQVLPVLSEPLALLEQPVRKAQPAQPA